MKEQSTMQKTRIELTCDACGKTFERPIAHIKKAKHYHFCCKECSHKPVVPITCIICNAIFHVNVYGIGCAKFCSKDCKRTYDRQLYAINKGSYRLVTKTCMECKQSYQVPLNRANVQKFCSQECSGAYIGREYHMGSNNVNWKPKIKIVCKQCGKEFETYPCRKERKFCSQKCTGSWLAGHCHSPTSIEIAIREVLQELGYLFKEQYRIGQWRVDFALPLHWLAIECDGVYWHSLPHNKERDERKNIDLINAGWEVLRLPGNEIRENLQFCIEKIEQAIIP